MRIESDGFTAGGEALAVYFGDVKAGLELRNRMQTVLLDEFEQASLRRTHPHAADVNESACDLRRFDAAANAIPGFEHNDLLALAAERSTRAQPGETCTDNHNIGLSSGIVAGEHGSVILSGASRNNGHGSSIVNRCDAKAAHSDGVDITDASPLPPLGAYPVWLGKHESGVQFPRA